MERIIPLNTNILIEYQEQTEKQTKNGIYIPQSVDENATGFLRTGKVVEVNPDCTTIEVGDIVLFNKNATCTIPTDKTKRLVRTEDIYAVIKS